MLKRTFLPSSAYTDEEARDAIGAALTAGPGIALTPSDGDNTITIAAAAARISPNRTTTYVYAPARAKTTGNLSADGTVSLSSRLFDAGTQLDRLACEITTAGTAGALARMGIWADNGAGVATTRLLDAGTVDATTTGVKELTIAYTIPTTGRYWFSISAEVAQIGFRSLTAAWGDAGKNTSEAFGANLFSTWFGYATGVTAGGYPSTLPNWNFNSGAQQVAARIV